MTTAPIPTAELERLIELGKRATDGPWTTEKPSKDGEGWARGVVVAAVARGQCVYADPPGGSYPENDRKFIAAARTAPALAAELIAAREALVTAVNTAKLNLKVAQDRGAVIAMLKEALAGLLKEYDEERQAIDCAAEPSCAECTLGTTPSHLDKGPCAYHKARALLPSAGQETE